jgi:probable HAF family extracellular repeat protein
MKFTHLINFTAGVLFVALAMTVSGAAQNSSSSGRVGKHNPRYRLVDLGTFGGPASYFPNGSDGILNNNGTAAGWANTADVDPICFSFVSDNCFVTHAFRAHGGIMTDLGVLDGGIDSAALWISANGLSVGFSQIGETDPLVPGFPELRGVLWRRGEIINLGTLPAGGFESAANAVNSRGQVVGFALNTVEDPCAFFGGFPQTRGFLWHRGVMQDLGTLGGPQADAEQINEAGQVIGISSTSFLDANGCPVVHPYFWEDGFMQDIGTLGGTFFELHSLNERGQVVGFSSLTGDQTFHPFLWSKGHLIDLGTLGGDNGQTNWINDRGDIVGKADLPGPAPQLHDAVLWKNRHKIDLGVLPGDACSNAYFINSHGQIVGTSETFEFCTLPEPAGQHAFLRDPAGRLKNLNTLIPPGASLDLTHAVAINDRGEIAGFGVPPDCAPQDVGQCGHAYLLIPCTGHECVNTTAGNSTPSAIPSLSNAVPARPANPLLRFKNQMRNKFQPRGQGRYPVRLADE